MRVRPSCLCLSLLASLWAGGAAPATAADVSHSGTVGLSLSPRSVSGIPIDVTAVSDQVCEDAQGKSPLVQCHVIVKNESVQIQVLGKQAWTDELQLAGAEPLATPCGLWDTTLTLDPGVSQPASPIAFEARPDDLERGLFATALEMSTVLHLVHRETGRTADFPLRLALGLAGPWVFASANPPAAGRLFLLADQREDGQVITFENCIPAWVLDDPYLVVVPTAGCEICLTARDVPAVANGGGDSR